MSETAFSVDLQRKPFAEVEAADIGVGDEFVGRAGAEDAAFGHDVGAVGDGEGFADVVVGDEDADSLLFEVEDDLADVVDGQRVDAGEGFVEEDELRLGRQAAGDLDSAAFTARKGVAASASDVGDAEFFEQLIETGEPLGPLHRHRFEHRQDVLLGRHLAKDRSLLRQIPEAKTGPQVHRQAGHILAIEVNDASLGGFETDEHVKAGRLACTIRPEQADDLAVVDVKAHIVNHAAASVRFLQVLGGDGSLMCLG
jgi:hypothetical protein